MKNNGDIFRILGRIEGRLIGFEKVSERVAKLEMWQYWLKGGCAFLMAALAYLCSVTYGK